MIAKITHITGNGTYNSPHGMLFKQLYVFDDNVEVSANHKTEASPFSIGDEVEYEINGSNSYGSWGKVRRPDQEGKYSAKSVTVGGDRSEVIERSWAMGQAISMLGVLPSKNDSAIDSYLGLAAELAKTILALRDTFPHYKVGVFEHDLVDLERPSDTKWSKKKIEAMDLEAEKSEQDVLPF